MCSLHCCLVTACVTCKQIETNIEWHYWHTTKWWEQTSTNITPPPSNVEKKHYITIIHDFIYEIRICIYFSYSYLNKVKGFNECCGRHNAFFTFQRCPTLHLSEVSHITPVWGVPHYTCLRCPTLHLSEVSHITPVWGVPHYTCLRCPTLHLSEVSHITPVWGVPHYTCLRCSTLHLSEVFHITPVWGVPHYTCLRYPTCL